ncbi:MAG TPA: hypothetical protein VN824_09090 [Puia sp.]|nr:hypothetical protein [Puia sp.]
MKIVRVIYTIAPEYVVRNQENIRAITNELRAMSHPGIRYSTYLLPDGKTFMHLDHFENEEAHRVLEGLESFKKFATELHANGFEVEPKLELLSFVAASYDVLDGPAGGGV